MCAWTRFCGCAGWPCWASSLAIFIVRRGSNSTCRSIPCLIIVSLSVLLNLALQIAFNPMQRLEPAYAAALLALNIVELAALLFFTGGLQNPFSFLFLAPVLISATALPVRLTIALGMLAVACASVLVFYYLPLPWDSEEPLMLPPIYLFGVWLSIVVAIGVTCSTRSRSPKRRGSFPTRWPRPNWCWRASSI